MTRWDRQGLPASPERQRRVQETRRWRSGLVIGALSIPLVAIALTARPHGIDSVARLRRPVAVVPSSNGHRLFVANARAGSISVIDMDRRQVIAEPIVGRMLADLTDAGGDRLLAVDQAAGELIVLTGRGDSMTVTGRLQVGESPISVRSLPNGRATVACLWPRRLAVIEGVRQGSPRLRKTIALPFAPRTQLLLPGGEKLIIADAFGGKLAVVDVRREVVESVRAVPGHNIRGLALHPDGKQILLSQQHLSEETPTRTDDIRWGNVMTNGVRSLALEDVVKPDADLLRRSRLQTLGEFHHGAADPAGLVVVEGKVIVALSGTGEVAFGPELRGDWIRLTVGRRPTALDTVGRQALVVDTFGDSVTILDIPDRKIVATISLGQTPPLSPAERGELLFFDGRLSVEGWMSCHSCHSDGHTNGLRSDTLADGSYGAPKRVPTLGGVGDTAPWAWNGSMARLEEQISQSIRTTMRGPRPTDRQVADLAAYLRTLPPPPAPQRGKADESIRRGKAVFESLGCARCHASPTYTTPRTYEVGLEDELGKTAFNPPSLRGVAQGTAFLHDGRAVRLKDVFTRNRHQVPPHLARNDLENLLAFLRTL